MSTFTIYIDDDDYAHVVTALAQTRREMGDYDEAMEPELLAREAIVKLIEREVRSFSLEEFLEGLAPPGLAAPREWVQPEGGHDAYDSEARPEKVVLHNGSVWESNTPNNVWEPGVFGWTQL